MQLESFSRKLITTEVTKSYTDFQDASTSKSVDIINLPAGSAMMEMSVENASFTGIPSNRCLLSIDKDFINNEDVTHNKSIGAYRDFGSDPFLTVPSAWSIGADVDIARRQGDGCGTSSAGLLFGGYSTANLESTEEFDGSSWSTGGDLNLAKTYSVGTGTQAAGLSFGGYSGGASDTCEEYGGSAWSAGGSLNSAIYLNKGCGTQTAGLSFGGSGYSSTTEEYNGASWSVGGSLNTGRQRHFGTGTQTAGLCCGGSDGDYISSTEEYDGASWTNVSGDMLLLIGYGAAAGVQTDAVVHGGRTQNIDCVTYSETYNGTIWTSSYHLSIGRRQHASSSSSGESCIATTGAVEPFHNTSSTELLETSGFDDTQETIQATVKSDGIGAWSMGGDILEGKYRQSGFGTQNAGVICGGTSAGTGNLTTSEEYNGVGWSAGGVMSQARRGAITAGTMTSGLTAGGYISEINTEEYNGTAWSAGGNLNVGRGYSGGCGTQTAALSLGGYPDLNDTEEYNGVSWSTTADMLTGRYAVMGCGSQTNALNFGGYTTIDSFDNTESYNGNTWAVENNLLETMGGGIGAGSSSSAALGAGYNSIAEEFDGLNWQTSAALNYGSRSMPGTCGDEINCVVAGGYSGYYRTDCEHWNKVDTQNLTNLSAGNLTFTIRYINYND